MLVFSSYGRGCSSELVQAVDRFITLTPPRNSHPTGSAKGCRGAAWDILVVALASHNTAIPPCMVPQMIGNRMMLRCGRLVRLCVKYWRNRDDKHKPKQFDTGRSRWPRDLKHGSAAERLLGLRVRISSGACLSDSSECCVLSGRGLCVRPIPRSEESYRLYACHWMRSDQTITFIYYDE